MQNPPDQLLTCEEPQLKQAVLEMLGLVRCCKMQKEVGEGRGSRNLEKRGYFLREWQEGKQAIKQEGKQARKTPLDYVGTDGEHVLHFHHPHYECSAF